MSETKPREVLNAARLHAETEGDNGNAEISFIAGYDYAVQRLEARIQKLREALKFVADDLNIIGITPTECSHLAKLQNALKADDEASK